MNSNGSDGSSSAAVADSFSQGFAAAQNDPWLAINAQKAMESCPVKSVMALGAGFALGGLFGMFMTSADWQTSEEFQKMTTRQQVKATMKDMATKSYSSAKNFAVVGAVFAGTECIIESVS
ncbi:Mitochondrial import inner membrane translocase subunit tim22 [Chytridiales sp. JEL 0842]|nr:Mitochondrial import inner membrane translocase subunit tim22 [Chytridiales sp. JEL 0842]